MGGWMGGKVEEIHKFKDICVLLKTQLYFIHSYRIRCVLDSLLRDGCVVRDDDEMMSQLNLTQMTFNYFPKVLYGSRWGEES